MTKCSHHFHLGCIYEWMERSDNRPVCGKEKSMSKASADGLLEAVSFTTPETLKGTAEGASKYVEPPKECPVIANEEKGFVKDDDVHKNLDLNQEFKIISQFFKINEIDGSEHVDANKLGERSFGSQEIIQQQRR